jgi:RNA polymerase primary sigma factor
MFFTWAGRKSSLTGMPQETPKMHPNTQESISNPRQESSPGNSKRGGKALEFVNQNDAVSAYLNEIKGIKSLTLAEEQELAQRIQKGDGEALNLLVQANLKFVVAVCRNYQYHGLPMADLINEGNLGLIRAARRFDASLNYKFISYAVWWVRQGILAAIAEQSKTITVSAGRAGLVHKAGKANQKLEQALGRSPSSNELAEEMGISEFELNEILQLAAAPKSLSAPLNSDDGDTLESVLEDSEGKASDADARHHLLKQKLAALVGTLEDREQMVLRLYFGLGGTHAITLEEISQRLGLTRERIRQIKTKALERLQHPSRISSLVGFRT